ncbi:hypothetical protein [uncultured Gammaproteobacteria bacterium]|nr:hypothetical protein [uncultured Gammaproteobacteria bacterium]
MLYLFRLHIFSFLRITPNSVAAGRGSMSSDNTLNFDIK